MTCSTSNVCQFTWLKSGFSHGDLGASGDGVLRTRSTGIENVAQSGPSITYCYQNTYRVAIFQDLAILKPRVVARLDGFAYFQIPFGAQRTGLQIIAAATSFASYQRPMACSRSIKRLTMPAASGRPAMPVFLIPKRCPGSRPIHCLPH